VNVESTLEYLGQVITLLAKGTETNGRFAFMAVKVRPGTEPPPHIHVREHELFFVLEGAIRFYTPKKTFDVQAGGAAFLPQGKAHTFACLTNEIRALLLAAASGEQTVGMDGYFLAMGEPARDMVLPDAVITNAVDDPEQAISVGASWAFASSRRKTLRKRFRSILTSAYFLTNRRTLRSVTNDDYFRRDG
jgi:quercetin dioxygenase-like cupin family protein